ncbi:hypothetical protein V8F06_012124 [Rhypophila decipiens]
MPSNLSFRLRGDEQDDAGIGPDNATKKSPHKEHEAHLHTVQGQTSPRALAQVNKLHERLINPVTKNTDASLPIEDIIARDPHPKRSTEWLAQHDNRSQNIPHDVISRATWADPGEERFKMHKLIAWLVLKHPGKIELSDERSGGNTPLHLGALSNSQCLALLMQLDDNIVDIFRLRPEKEGGNLTLEERIKQTCNALITTEGKAPACPYRWNIMLESYPGLTNIQIANPVLFRLLDNPRNGTSCIH